MVTAAGVCKNLDTVKAHQDVGAEMTGFNHYETIRPVAYSPCRSEKLFAQFHTYACVHGANNSIPKRYLGLNVKFSSQSSGP